MTIEQGTEEKAPEGIEMVEETAAPITISADQAAEAGLDATEIAMAKKHGMITETPAKEEDTKPADDAKPETDAPKIDDKTNILDVVKQDLSGKEEHDTVKALDKVGQAYYWAQKTERKKRQQAEIDRDFLATSNKALKDQIAALEARQAVKPAPKAGADDIDGMLGEEDAEPGKPLTKKDLEDVVAEKTAEAAAQAQTARKLSMKLTELDAQARVDYEDYDTAIDLAQDLIKNGQDLLKDNPKQFAKAQRLFNEWRTAAMNALHNDGPYTAADLAHELGTLHPKYGKKAEDAPAVGDPAEDAGAGKLPEDKLNKAIKNLEKPPSSASLNGNGKRFVAYDKLTSADVARMSREQYAALPRAVRERLLNE